MTILDFYKMKKEEKPISMVTCYDAWTASLMAESDIDCLLVGDSLAMVMHGHSSTLPADTELMALHTAAVRRGAPNQFIVTDMPFLSHRKGLEAAMESVHTIMKSGANAVKIEGIEGHKEIIRHIVQSGVPVMGHLGLTPQSFNQFGGFKVQNKTDESIDILLKQAKELEEAGCFSLVAECVPYKAGKLLSESLNIPVIGIGAGRETDGQVLVFQDLMGLNTGYVPKFVRDFGKGRELITGALNEYNRTVKNRSFPSREESYNG